MEVKPNSRKEYEFGLAAKTCHTEVKVGSREFQADMFNALQVAGGKMINIEIQNNQRIVSLVTVDGREHQLDMKRMKSFKDEDRITSKNWLSWIVPGIKELHYRVILSQCFVGSYSGRTLLLCMTFVLIIRTSKHFWLLQCI